MVQIMPRINTEYREDAKKKIIDAAVEVAAEDGWGALTLDAVARKVGVTKGAFYSYFANSGTLMQDVIVAMIRRLRDHCLNEPLRRCRHLRGAGTRCRIYFPAAKTVHPGFHPGYLRRCQRTRRSWKKIIPLFDENSALIVDALARFQKDGQIPAEVDLTDAARAIYSMTMGLGLFTHVLGKDAMVAKQTWMTSVERILLLDRKGKTGKQ